MPAVISRPVDVANQLRPVLLHLNRHLRREVHTSGVSAGQLSLLGLIAGNPGIGVADLAAREGTSMPSVCSHIDRLEASGLVTRRQAERDRRRVDLEVTPEGERVLKVVEPLVAKEEFAMGMYALKVLAVWGNKDNAPAAIRARRRASMSE